MTRVRAVTGLPDRFHVAYSHVKGQHFLDDGSNFVAWVDDKTDDEVRQLAQDAIARHEARVAAYVTAMEGNTSRHAGCDHAYGICSG